MASNAYSRGTSDAARANPDKLIGILGQGRNPERVHFERLEIGVFNFVPNAVQIAALETQNAITHVTPVMGRSSAQTRRTPDTGYGVLPG
jgi:hypothetical protein